MKSLGLNRYEKIIARPDKKRPTFIKDLMKEYNLHPSMMVLKAKLLTPDGNIIEISWSEKGADESTLREKTGRR